MRHICFLLLIVASVRAATAATFEVSPSGSIAQALSRMGSGDTLIIHAGTYAENNLHPPSGVTVEGALGESVILRPSGNAAPGFELGSASNVTIRNLTIDGGEGGISYGIRTNGGGSLFDTVTIQNTQNQGIALYCPGDNHTNCGGGGNTVNNVHVSGSGTSGCHGTTAQDGYCHGIYVYSDNNTIQDSEFDHNNGYGIQTYGAHTVLVHDSVHDNRDGHGVTIPGYRAFDDNMIVNWDGSDGSQMAGTFHAGVTVLASVPPPPSLPPEEQSNAFAGPELLQQALNVVAPKVPMVGVT